MTIIECDNGYNLSQETTEEVIEKQWLDDIVQRFAVLLDRNNVKLN